MGGEVVDITGSYAIMWWLAVGLGVFAMAMHLLLDEGPAPEPPKRGPRGLAPVALALFVVASGTAASLSLSASPASASTNAELPAADHEQPAMAYCVLGPLVSSR